MEALLLPCSDPAWAQEQRGQGCPGCPGSQGALRGLSGCSGCVRVSASSECVTDTRPCQHHPSTKPIPTLCPACVHLLTHLRLIQGILTAPWGGAAPVPTPFLGSKPPCLHGYKSFHFQPQGVLASPCSVALALTFVI